MKKIALITGITGQDGSYLAEHLLENGYEVHGIIRRSSTFNRGRIEHIPNLAKSYGLKFELHYGDMTDASSLNKIVSTVNPDEVYNLAAQSHVKISFECPESTLEINANGTLRLLEAIRIVKPDCRFYQASTSELFGLVQETPQRETTPFYPRSPYGVSKLYAYWIVVNYRESYGLHASNGILFNHESPRRGENFVTRKITLSLARIRKGLQETLNVGNLNAERDWGFAKDYVEMMHLMLKADKPDDYVAATGEKHTVREFIEIAAEYAGYKIQWEGSGSNEVGRDIFTGKIIVKVDPHFYRPAEVDILLGDSSKAREKLGWKPKKTFVQLVQMMMAADLNG